MQPGDVGHDRQAQTAAGATGTPAPMKALPKRLALLGGHAGTVVFHAQFGDGAQRAGANRDLGAAARMLDGVVDQVAQQLIEQHRVAID